MRAIPAYRALPLIITCTLAGGLATVGAKERYRQLPEVVVETRKHNVLHLLAYVREYSTLTTYSDTIFMFREKMVDFMLPQDRKSKFKGWKNPRMLKCSSYYRFTDNEGLDSVSDICNHHFSWSDWVGVPNTCGIPKRLLDKSSICDTVQGKYNAAEIWTKKDDKVSVWVNVLTDTLERRWVPQMDHFFKQGIDFDKFKIRFDYDNVLGHYLMPSDLSGYTYLIESNGRGRVMFRFNKPDQPYYVTTNAEVYLLDREYITTKEARRWEDHKFDKDEIEIVQPPWAPAIPFEVQNLMARINNIDRKGIRLMQEPDRKLGSGKTKSELRKNFQIGNRLLLMLKQLTGITAIKSRKKQKDNWNNYIKHNEKTDTLYDSRYMEKE